MRRIFLASDIDFTGVKYPTIILKDGIGILVEDNNYRVVGEGAEIIIMLKYEFRQNKSYNI